MIQVNLDIAMAKRHMSSSELCERLGITAANLSILKNNRGKAIRFSTLNALCRILECQVTEILEYVPEENDNGK
ncbi:MAG: transcriptional regulator [Clostridia bacterium]|nr:transcriptional regulator [Clostridia bacterium]